MARANATGSLVLQLSSDVLSPGGIVSNVTASRVIQIACGRALLAILGLRATGTSPSQGIVWYGGRKSY